MSQPRLDLYGTIHKGLRARLFDLAVELDRCDFEDTTSVAITLAAFRRTLAFLREHHQHEDDFVAPVLRRIGVDDRVDAQHREAAGALDELEALAAGRGVGSRLASAYRAFLVAYLGHLEHEETEINAALWAHLTDAELAEIRGRIQGSIPPARFAAWLEIVLPAINLGERVEMLGGIKAGAPAPAFAAALDVAGRVLGTAGLDAVRTRLEPE